MLSIEVPGIPETTGAVDTCSTSSSLIVWGCEALGEMVVVVVVVEEGASTMVEGEARWKTSDGESVDSITEYNGWQYVHGEYFSWSKLFY